MLSGGTTPGGVIRFTAEGKTLTELDIDEADS
jgi:hypothetical protein